MSDWMVWLRDGDHGRPFPTFEEAERYARRYVATTDNGDTASIWHADKTVARVSMDSAGRVWTDVLDPVLI